LKGRRGEGAKGRRGAIAIAAFGVITAFGAIAALAACEDNQKYVYSARQYDPINMCVGEYVPVEQVTGSGAGSKCAPSCSMVGSDLYVSTMCPPLPGNATAVDDTDPACMAAMAAFASGGTCDMPAAADGGDDAADSSAADSSKPPQDAGDAG